MKVRVLQRGFNFSQDGPGNRLVYHLQGCTMRDVQAGMTYLSVMQDNLEVLKKALN